MPTAKQMTAPQRTLEVRKVRAPNAGQPVLKATAANDRQEQPSIRLAKPRESATETILPRHWRGKGEK